MSFVTQASDPDEALLRKHRRVLNDCRAAFAECEPLRGLVTETQQRQALSALSDLTQVMAATMARQQEIKVLLARTTRQVSAVSAYARVGAIKGGENRSIRH